MLISTIAQIRTASSVNISNSFDNWYPYLLDAEEIFIIPTLGRPVYDYLNAMVFPKGPLVEQLDGYVSIPDILLAKVHRAIALYALYLGVDEMAVSISGAGIQVIQSDTHKPAPQYQIMNVKETFLSRAHRQMDGILEFLAANGETFQSVQLPKSPYFIRSAAEFQLHADIHSSRRVFLSLMPVIGSIEKKYIKPTLSALQFDDLKQKIQSGEDLSPDDQSLLDLVIPALVHLTMARALLEISIDTLDWGIFNNASNTFVNVQNKERANKERISAMHEANRLDGEAELKMLQEYLDNNASADKYPLYFASNRYVGPINAVKRSDFPNSSTNSIFVA
ncbi:MAG: hypothetical protein Q8M08_17420 [Bacteroidales bacterium]|nr:hypothetical protein [Bacteroidales bacterium]